MWARGALQHDYGVDLSKITWVATDDEHVAEYRPPANVDMTFANKKDVVELLVSGDCAAAVGDVKTDHPDIKPLIADARDAGIAYYKKTGIYPLNHAVVIKDSVLAEMPGIAGRLMDAFAQSKAAYMARLEQLHREPKRNGPPSLLVGEGWGGGDGNERAGLGATRIGTAGVPPNPFPSPQGGGELRLTSADEAAIALGKAVGGDPFPYGIEANRKALEAMVQYAVEQHVMPRGYSAEELFAATHQ